MLVGTLAGLADPPHCRRLSAKSRRAITGWRWARRFCATFCLLLVLPGSSVVAQDFPELEPEPLVPVGPDQGAPPRLVEPDRAGSLEIPRTVLHVHGGLSMLQRTYTLDSRDTALEFSSSLYPAVYVGGDVFPFRNKEWLEDLGLAVEFKRGVDRVVIDEGGVTRKVPVRHSEIGLALLFRYQLDQAFWVRGDAGFTALDFVLSRNPFYTNTTYRALRLGVNGEYRVLPSVSAVGELNLFPVVGLGASEAEFGTGSSTFGAGLTLGAQADLVDGVYVRAGYMIRFFNTTFEGTGERELESVVTTDIYHDLTLWMGYRL